MARDAWRQLPCSLASLISTIIISMDRNSQGYSNLLGFFDTQSWSRGPNSLSSTSTVVYRMSRVPVGKTGDLYKPIH